MAVDEGRAEEDVVRAKMIEHDEQVGTLLQKLEDMGVDDNTIVIYTHRQRQRADAVARRRLRAVPRREGLRPGRAACACRCCSSGPARSSPDSVSNGIQSHEDIFVTLASAAGLPSLKEELLTGKRMGDMTYKVHLDGYDNLAHWTGESEEVRASRDISTTTRPT